MGLDGQQLVTLLDGGPLGSPYGLEKLGEMQRHDYPAGFPVRLALKDLKLVREVAQSAGVELPVLTPSSSGSARSRTGTTTTISRLCTS